MSPVLLAVAAVCTAVEGDHILAGDMARAWPEFASVAAETPLGYASAPGVRRQFSPAELGRLGARFGVRGPAPAVCMERRAAPLTRERVLAAMRTTLGMEEASIEIVELSRYPVPEGEVVFARQGLRAPGSAAENNPLLWRGEIRSGARRCPVWARVMLRVPLVRVYAIEDLRGGAAARAEQLREECGAGFPQDAGEATSIAQIAGRFARRAIRAGSAVRLDMFSDPRDIEAGDSVAVQVSSGAARLAFTARAESAGSTGQSVRVRNPSTRRVFTARVSGKGRVVVDAGGGSR